VGSCQPESAGSLGLISPMPPVAGGFPASGPEPPGSAPAMPLDTPQANNLGARGSWFGSSASSSTRPQRRKLLQAGMPPLPKWLKRELSKVKLPSKLSGTKSNEQSTATLPSLDSAMTGTSSGLPSSDTMPEEEVRRMLFLRDQLSGCAPVMRGEIEEIWQMQRSAERDRARLRSAELHAVRHAQRAKAKVLRQGSQKEDALRELSASLQQSGGLEDRPQPPVRISTQVMADRVTGVSQVQPNSASSSRHQSKILSPRQSATVVPAAPRQSAKRRTFLDYLKHTKSWGDRQMAMERLRHTLKRHAAEASKKEEDQMLFAAPEEGGRKRRSRRKQISSRTAQAKEARPSKKGKDSQTEALMQAYNLDPKVAVMHEAFGRYDADRSGILELREIRQALGDIGICPSLSEEKRAINKLIAEELAKSEGDSLGIEFCDFVPLVPRLREAMQEVKRTELEEWFARGLNEKGEYDIEQLGQVLEAMGSTGFEGEAEWKEVLQIFEGFEAAVALCTQTPTQSPRTNGGRHAPEIGQNGNAAIANIIMRAQSAGVSNLSALNNQFDIFEMLFLQAQERLVVMKREKERDLCRDLDLTDEQCAEFRSDVVELHSLFKQFDYDDSGVLEENEVFKCLASCGLQRKNGLERKALNTLIMKARCKAKAAGHTSHRNPLATERLEGEEGEDLLPSKELNEAGALDCDFCEFLSVMIMVRKINREAESANIRAVFNSYDSDRSGNIEIKEIIGLFQDLGLQPKTREEQHEIRMIWDEADEDGNGSFTFNEFERLVHSVQEHLDRLTRREEEKFALELGMQITRCRELRDVFHQHCSDHAFSTSTLSVAELRHCVEDLHLRYTSEELLGLYDNFCREDRGGIDCRGFLRMMYHIEVLKTHGQQKQRLAHAVAHVHSTTGAHAHGAHHSTSSVASSPMSH